MPKRKSSIPKYFFAHVMLPLVVGSLLYYLFCPEVLFVKWMDAFLPFGFHITEKGLLWRFVRFYLFDFLWAYALVFALYIVQGNNIAKISTVFWMAGIFSVVMETLQIIPGMNGQFDLWDIVVELTAEGIAVFIIKTLH